MASELSEAVFKNVTGKLIDNIVNNTPDSKYSETAKTWWEENKATLIGLSIAELVAILKNAADKKELSKRYDELVASMTWAERIEFLKGGVDELKESNSKKIRTVTIIAH